MKEEVITLRKEGLTYMKKIKCKLCKKELENYWVLEAPNFLDILMCKECAVKARKIVLETLRKK